MTTLMNWTSRCVLLLGLCLVAVGCDRPDATPVTTDMHEDFDHDHDHHHGPGHDHEHEHDDGFEGSHSHPHSHSHRHGEPLHGGEIVSIGHSHHQAGATYYHAEVLPISDDQIIFYVLTESDDGKSQEHAIDANEIIAFLNEAGADPAQAQEVTFTKEGDEASARFKTVVPEEFSQSQKVSIVVPKITLGGERLNFSFTASRTELAANSAEATSDTESQP